jgi:hypothetical protein
MINSKITRNKAVDDLSDDTSRLAYTWLITFADVEGRTNGDPALVRSLVFPRRTDVSVDRMTAYIREWAAAGLVLWYQADGDVWIRLTKRWSGNERPEGAVIAWRTAVFERDNYTCQVCGGRGIRLEAHHLKPWFSALALRFDTDNGVTLCRACHRARHGKGWMHQAERDSA